MVLMRRLSIGLFLACVATQSGAQDAPARGFFRGGQAGGVRPLLFGFALECSRCTPVGRGRGGQGFGGGRGVLGLWHYDEYPRIAAVVPGSAAQRAGIRVGDVLLAVDGISITSDEGSQRFSELRAGDTAHLTLDRGDKKSMFVDLVLDRGGRGGAVVEAPSAEAPNFTTRAHGARVDVWSDGRVVQSTDSAGATILRIGNTVIRLSDELPAGGLRGARGRRGAQPPTN